MGSKRLALLHGFGGSSEDWRFVLGLIPGDIRVIRPDIHVTRHLLPLERLIKNLADELHPGDSELHLAGYSMGGRLALLLVEEFFRRGLPLPKSLTLFSTGLGESGPEASSRAARDASWAALLQKSPEEFWEKWYSQPLFEGLRVFSDPRFSDWLEKRKSFDNNILSEHIRAFSPASHPPLEPILKKALQERISVLYIHGERDKKYCELACDLRLRLPGLKTVSVPGCRHILPVEASQACAELLNSLFR